MRALIATTVVFAACSAPAAHVDPPAASAASSAPIAAKPPATAAPKALSTRPASWPLVARLGPVGFGSGRVVAMTKSGDRVATAVAFPGAELELFTRDGRRTGKLSVGLDAIVASADFSTDGSEIVVATVGKPAEVVVLRTTDGERVRKLPALDGASRVRFLADGSIVALVGERALRLDRDSVETVADKDIVGLAVSPDRRRFALAMKSSVRVFSQKGTAWKPGKDVKRAAGRGLFVGDDGTLIESTRRESAIVRGGQPTTLDGEVTSAGSALATLVVEEGSKLVDIATGKIRKTLPFRVTISADDATLLADTGDDVDKRFSAIPTSDVVADTSAFTRSWPSTLSFSRDGRSLYAPDRDAILEWDVGAAKARRLPLPKKPFRGVYGIFLGPEDLFVMAGEVFRLDGAKLVEIGQSEAGSPHAFQRKDGSVSACFTVRSEGCLASLAMPRGTRALDDKQLVFAPLLLGADRALCEGDLAAAGGSSLGPCTPVRPSGSMQRPAEAWLDPVSVIWALPTEAGGVLVLDEVPNDPSGFTVRAVDHDGVGAACGLGVESPATTTPAVHPDGKRLMIMRRTGDARKGARVELVDWAACAAETLDLPAPAVGMTFSPDGKRLAVGLEDRTVAIYAVER